MSKREWAAIVYGRSYHLDFRFITLPHNFTPQDISWASQHIIATTQRARNLSGSPRWSLFKSDNYCVFGVTCMVRDLIGQLSEDVIEVMTKDDQGRPLYVFVGYVTQLSQDKNIQNFPKYTENQLDSFENLYQEIEKVWLVKNYESESRQPLLSQYQSRNFSATGVAEDALANPLGLVGDIATPNHQVPQLNHQSKYPDKTYLWPSLTGQNHLLWQTSFHSAQPTSICLNIQGKALADSLFLNQTISSLDSFQVVDRILPTKDKSTSSSEDLDDRANSSLSQKISNRAREDINLTIEQAVKVATASQEMINHLRDLSNHCETDSNKQFDLFPGEVDNFGFKTKNKTNSSSDSGDQDWF